MHTDTTKNTRLGGTTIHEREADKNNVLLTSPGFDLNLLSALRAQNLETEAKGQR